VCSSDLLSVSERMRRDVQVGVELDDLTKANELMINYGRGFLPIVSEEHTLKAVVFKKDLEHHILHPQANEDAQKRLIVGAAVSTHPKDRERIISLIEEQVDFLVIDASDGHSVFQAETLEFIKENHDIPVIAGNVVTAQGFDFLVAAGADAIKVGMGIGSGCITQEAKATGRGQATAIMDIVKARKDYEDETGNYIPIIADGSVNSPAEICIALALGADSVMMGNYFARCTESPGKLSNRYAENKAMELKEYWMEGSAKAKSLNSSERNGRYYQGEELNDEQIGRASCRERV